MFARSANSRVVTVSAGWTDMAGTGRKRVVAEKGEGLTGGELRRLRGGRVRAQHVPGDDGSVFRVDGGGGGAEEAGDGGGRGDEEKSGGAALDSRRSG